MRRASDGLMTGEEFRDIRKRLDLTQETLGAVLGCHLVRISEYERGVTPIPLLVWMLMDAFDAGYRPAAWPSGGDKRRREDDSPTIRHQTYKRDGKDRETWIVTYFADDGERRTKWCLTESAAEAFRDTLLAKMVKQPEVV